MSFDYWSRRAQDYLDAYVLKAERDEVIEIIRNYRRALAKYRRQDGGKKELIGQPLDSLREPEAAAMTARSDKFTTHVS